METELKYDLDKKTAEKIFDDVMIHFIEDGEVEDVPMDAVYFDTGERDLSRAEITFRIRREGSSYFSTLKWNSQTTETEALSLREEMNIRLTEEQRKAPPTIGIFKDSDISDYLEELAGGKALEPIMEMKFLRRQVRVDTGNSISELSVDTGEILAGGRTVPIHELEIEFFSGDVDDMLSLGKRLQEKYQLQPETRSKFARGLALLKEEIDE